MVSHVRADLDFYIEPEWCTAALLALPTFAKMEAVYDPCCGQGSVLRAAVKTGRGAFGSDIHPNRAVGFPYCFSKVRNEDLHDYAPYGALAVVSNPPYGRGKRVEQFIRHFHGLPRAFVTAVFVQTRFLHSTARHAFFHTLPPTIVGLLSTRPSCPPGDAFMNGEVKATGGSQDYCWLIYDKREQQSAPRVVWLKRPTEAKAVTP